MNLPGPLSELDRDEAATLERVLESVSYEADAVIVAAGAASDGCLFVDEGTVRLEAPRDHVDNDVTLGYVEAGRILGELSLLDDQPRSVDAVAHSRVRGRWLATAAFEQLVDEHPALGNKVLRALGRDAASKLRATTVRLADLLVAETTDDEVEDLVARAKAAQAVFAEVDEATVDAVLADLAQLFAEQAGPLAEAAVAQTGLGNVADKTLKITFAALGVHRDLAAGVGTGVLTDPDNGVTEVAAPAGVVFGIIPVTNPIATSVFKVLSCLKTRNALILSFHRICLGLAEEVGQLAHQVLERHGVPTDLVLWVRTRASRQKTAMFMKHPDVSLVLATGGPGMVRAAYSSGTPALGVGSGNAPCWVASDADLDRAAQAIVLSKSFDHGLICGSEHNLVVDASVVDGFREALERAGAAVLDTAETERFLQGVCTEDGGGFRPEVTGQSAQTIAGLLGIERDHPVSVIVFPADPDLASAVTAEKMSPLLSLFTADGDDEAIALSRALLDRMGAGHTAIVHSRSEHRVERFAAAVPASRILVNGPGSQGVSGLTTGLHPSLTLGCGTFGGNSTSDNVTYRNLRNVKRVARSHDPDPELLGAAGAR